MNFDLHWIFRVELLPNASFMSENLHHRHGCCLTIIPELCNWSGEIFAFRSSSWRCVDTVWITYYAWVAEMQLSLDSNGRKMSVGKGRTIFYRNPVIPGRDL